MDTDKTETNDALFNALVSIIQNADLLPFNTCALGPNTLPRADDHTKDSLNFFFDKWGDPPRKAYYAEAGGFCFDFTKEQADTLHNELTNRTCKNKAAAVQALVNRLLSTLNGTKPQA